MLLQIPAGSTSKIVQLPIFDSSSSTGALLTGLVYNSSGLSAYYNREGAAGSATAISLVTATKGTWASGGFVAVDGTNMPGWYELHIPDAALAAGAKSVSVHLKGATNMVPVPIIIELTAVNNQDAVRGGMTALPNANAEAAGGLFTRGTGAGQIRQDVNGTIGVDLYTIRTQAVTNAAGVTFHPHVGTTDASIAQTGDSFAVVKSGGTGDTAAIKAKTDNLPTSPAAVGSAMTLTPAYDAAKSAASQTSINGIPTNPLLTTDIRLNYLDASIASRSTYDGGPVHSVTNPVTVDTNNDKTGYSLSTTPPTATQIRQEMDSNSTKLSDISDNIFRVDDIRLPNLGNFIATDVDVQDVRNSIPSANDIDTVLTASHGAGSWAGGGSTQGAYTITVRLIEKGSDPAVPIPDVNLTLMNSDESAVLETKKTDADGYATFSRDAGTYRLRQYLAGYTCETATLEVVDTDISQDVAIIPTVITPSPNPLIQVVHGSHTEGGRLVMATPAPGQIIDASITLDQLEMKCMTAASSPHGWTLRLAIGAIYTIRIEGWGKEKTITISADPVAEFVGYLM